MLRCLDKQGCKAQSTFQVGFGHCSQQLITKMGPIALVSSIHPLSMAQLSAAQQLQTLW